MGNWKLTRSQEPQALTDHVVVVHDEHLHGIHQRTVPSVWVSSAVRV